MWFICTKITVRWNIHNIYKNIAERAVTVDQNCMKIVYYYNYITHTHTHTYTDLICNLIKWSVVRQMYM